MIKQLIAADGGDPEQFQSVTATVAGMLEQGAVDYVWTYYAWDNISYDLKGLNTHYISLRDLNPVFDYYTPIIITSRNYLQQHKKTARRFIRAVGKGYKYASENPDEAADILLEYAPELDSELVLRSARYLAPLYVDEQGRWGHQKPEVWDNLTRWMKDNGLIEKLVNIRDVMTNELVEF